MTLFARFAALYATTYCGGGLRLRLGVRATLRIWSLVWFGKAVLDGSAIQLPMRPGAGCHVAHAARQATSAPGLGSSNACGCSLTCTPPVVAAAGHCIPCTGWCGPTPRTGSLLHTHRLAQPVCPHWGWPDELGKTGGMCMVVSFMCTTLGCLPSRARCCIG